MKWSAAKLNKTKKERKENTSNAAIPCARKTRVKKAMKGDNPNYGPDTKAKGHY